MYVRLFSKRVVLISKNKLFNKFFIIYYLLITNAYMSNLSYCGSSTNNQFYLGHNTIE